jgi:uncharacterized protein YqeY
LLGGAIVTTNLERIQKELVEAMKSKDQLRLDVLRGIKTAIKIKEVEKVRQLSDAEVQQVFQTLVKQRKDSIEQFTKGGRLDLVVREESELRILEGYLPPPVQVAEISTMVDQAIKELNASSSKDVGRIMKSVMERFSGRVVDGKVVNQIVRDRLASENIS